MDDEVGDEAPSRWTRTGTATTTSLHEQIELEQSQQELRDFREVFALFDRDGSGSIDQDELGGVLEKLEFKCTQEDVEELFENADVKGNGAIGFDAFVQLMRKAFSPSSLNNRGRKQRPRKKNGERQFTDMTQYTAAILPPEPRLVNHQRRRFIAPLGGHLGTTPQKMVDKSLFMKAHRPRGTAFDTRANGVSYLEGLQQTIDAEQYEKHILQPKQSVRTKVRPQEHFQAQLRQHRAGTAMRPSTAPAELVTGPLLRRRKLAAAAKQATRVKQGSSSRKPLVSAAAVGVKQQRTLGFYGNPWATCQAVTGVSGAGAAYKVKHYELQVPSSNGYDNPWTNELFQTGGNAQAMHKRRSKLSDHQRGPLLQEAWSSSSSRAHGLADTVRFGGYGGNDQVRDKITGRLGSRKTHQEKLKWSSGVPAEARDSVARRDQQLARRWEQKMAAIELIQRSWRGHFHRDMSQLRASLRRRCAKRIQHWYRHRREKRNAVKMLKKGRNMKVLRAATRWYKLGWGFSKWWKCAIHISSVWRGVCERKRVGKMPAAASKIVLMCKRKISRKKLFAKSIVRVLSVVRCGAKMIRRQKIRLAAKKLHSWWRHWWPRRKMYKTVSIVVKRLWATKVLQRGWRMHKFLSAVKAKHAEYVELYSAAVIVQNMFRGWKARRFIMQCKHLRALWRLRNLVDNHRVLRATREIMWHFGCTESREKSLQYWQTCRDGLEGIIRNTMHEEVVTYRVEELVKVLHGVSPMWIRHTTVHAGKKFEMHKLNMLRAYCSQSSVVRKLFLLIALDGIKSLDQGLRVSKEQLRKLVRECGLSWMVTKDNKRVDAVHLNCLKPATEDKETKALWKKEKELWIRAVAPKQKEETKTLQLNQFVEALVSFASEMEPFKNDPTPVMHHCFLSLCERFLVPSVNRWWDQNFTERVEEMDDIAFSEEHEANLTKFFKFYSKSDTTDKGHKEELNAKEWMQLLTECKMTSKDVSLQVCMQAFLISGAPSQLRGFLVGQIREFEILSCFQVELEGFLAAIKHVLVRPTSKKETDQQIEDGIKKLIKNCPQEKLVKSFNK